MLAAVVLRLPGLCGVPEAPECLPHPEELGALVPFPDQAPCRDCAAPARGWDSPHEPREPGHPEGLCHHPVLLFWPEQACGGCEQPDQAARELRHSPQDSGPGQTMGLPQDSGGAGTAQEGGGGS
eukprot:10204871-Lingulodinium_polyedra.AAC.1